MAGMGPGSGPGAMPSAEETDKAMKIAEQEMEYRVELFNKCAPADGLPVDLPLGSQACWNTISK